MRELPSGADDDYRDERPRLGPGPEPRPGPGRRAVRVVTRNPAVLAVREAPPAIVARSASIGLLASGAIAFLLGAPVVVLSTPAQAFEVSYGDAQGSMVLVTDRPKSGTSEYDVDLFICGAKWLKTRPCRDDESRKATPGKTVPTETGTGRAPTGWLHADLIGSKRVDIEKVAWEDKTVLAGDMQHWQWRVSAPKPGDYSVTARVIQVDKTSGNRLSVTPEFTVDALLSFKESQSFWGTAQRIAHGLRDEVSAWVTLFGTIVGVVGGAMLLRRQRTDATTSTP